MITEIGVLANTLKTLIETAKAGAGLFGSKKPEPDTVNRISDRLAGIAEQLYQSVALSKMLPIWLKEHSTVNLYTDNLTDDEIKLLDLKLRDLISASIHDYFSGTFFRTNFATLPGVDAGIKVFRDRLIALELQLNGIPAGNAQAWRLAWPIVKVRMSDLRIEAVKLDNLAEEIHSTLINELRDASKIKA